MKTIFKKANLTSVGTLIKQIRNVVWKRFSQQPTEIIQKLAATNAFLLLISFSSISAHAEQRTVRIGLNADMSSGSAQAGQAIQQGIQLALDEINGAGGVLGHRVELVAKDHRGIPARGKRNMQQFASDRKVVAVFGGLHTPVVLAEKKQLFDTGTLQIPYLIPWAAGTPVTNNPWIFRLSVRDEYAGGFLIQKALSQSYSKVALLLERTPWGRSNEKSMTMALQKEGLSPQDIQWFASGAEGSDISFKLSQIYQSGAEVVMLVANAPEGASIIEQMALRKKERRLPIISHWGITGGNFPQQVGKEIMDTIDLSFLQTFSFIAHHHDEKVQKILSSAKRLYPGEVNELEDIMSPVGVAHAYDLTHLLALAIQQSGRLERDSIRRMLETLPPYTGIVRTYDPAFSPGQGPQHDALNVSDFTLAEYRQLPNGKWIIHPLHD